MSGELAGTLKHSNRMLSKPFGSIFDFSAGKGLCILIKLFSRWKHEVVWNLLVDGYFGPLSTSPVVLLLSPGMTRLSSLIQEWADNRNVTVVASFLQHGGPWCTDTSLSPFLVKLVLTFLDNPLKDEVIHVACAPFPVSDKVLLSSRFSITLLSYSTWEASLSRTFCDLPSLWKMLMIVIWTTVRSVSSLWLWLCVFALFK